MSGLSDDASPKRAKRESPSSDPFVMKELHGTGEKEEKDEYGNTATSISTPVPEATLGLGKGYLEFGEYDQDGWLMWSKDKFPYVLRAVAEEVLFKDFNTDKPFPFEPDTSYDITGNGVPRVTATRGNVVERVLFTGHDTSLASGADGDVLVLETGQYAMEIPETKERFGVVMKKQNADNDDYPLALEIEIMLLLGKHQNVCRLVGWAKPTEDLCEMYLRRYTATLERVSTTHMDMTTDEFRAIATGVFNGMRHIHRRGFAHTDLHMGNILVDFKRDRIERVVISDFGRALYFVGDVDEKIREYRWDDVFTCLKNMNHLLENVTESNDEDEDVENAVEIWYNVACWCACTALDEGMKKAFKSQFQDVRGFDNSFYTLTDPAKESDTLNRVMRFLLTNNDPEAEHPCTKNAYFMNGAYAAAVAFARTKPFPSPDHNAKQFRVAEIPDVRMSRY